MKKWLFLFMAFFTFTLISCNANTTTVETTTTTTSIPTTITTGGGTISESTIFLVEFDSGGSTLITDQNVFSGDLVDEPSITRTGYSLDGWYLSEDNGATFIKKWNFSSDTVTKDIKLYAVWNINQYTITFITNGGLGLDPLTQDYNSEIIIEEPIRFDYQFDGWYLDEELTIAFTYITMPAFDLTLYAKWIEIGNTFELHYCLLPEGFNPLTDEIVIETPRFISVSARSYFTVALTEGHEVYTWGYNEYYQLGDGTFINRATPTNITSFFDLDELDYIVQVEAGYMHSIALSSNGKVFTWGDNEDGELGVGDTDIYTSPIEITDNFELLPDEVIISIDAGNYHSAAITSLGRLFMWGYNDVGQLGTNIASYITLPTDITSEFNLNVDEMIIQTALGGNHTLVLTSENRIFSFGLNFSMQLGDGTNISRSTPIEITSNFDLGMDEVIVKTEAGNNHSGALTNLGNVFTFGLNTYGQLGNGNNTNQGLPVNITSQFLLDTSEVITDLFMGVHFSSAVTSLQKIFTWGLNDSGQLGNETFINSSVPVNISSLFAFNNENQIACISLGNGYITIIDTLGEMYLWGDNSRGALGIGTYIDESSPQNPLFWIPEILVFTYNEGENYNLYLPDRTGDTFIGWYIDLKLTQQFDFLINPDGPTILYSKWQSFPAILLERSEFLEPDGYHSYTFTITETSNVSIYTLSEIDTYGILRDSNENIIDQNDDGDIDYNFYINYTLEPGTYTIEVSGYDETETGPYELYVIKN